MKSITTTTTVVNDNSPDIVEIVAGQDVE